MFKDASNIILKKLQAPPNISDTSIAGHKFPDLASLTNLEVPNLSVWPFVPLIIQYDAFNDVVINTIIGNPILALW